MSANKSKMFRGFNSTSFTYSLCNIIKTTSKIIILYFKVVHKPDELVPYFVQDIMGELSGMTGLFLSCVFSAGLSTMSANLNSFAGIIYEDCIRIWINHTETRANFVMKLLVILTGAYSILMGFLVQKFGSILQITITLMNLNSGTTLGVFALGALWPWANSAGALWGALTSAITVSVLVIGSQLKILRTGFKYDHLPTNIDKCPADMLVNFNRYVKRNTKSVL